VDGGLVAIRVAMGPANGSSMELVVGVVFRVLGIFMGAGWRPRLVCFSHSAPQTLSVHRRVFGSAVEFGHEFDGMLCNAADLEVPNPGADLVMSRYTHRLLEDSSRRAWVSDRVREYIVILLPRGHCRVDMVAQHMGLHRRTVSRHLSAEGSTFSALVDGVRRELLERYLEEGTRPLGEVSALLGFSALSAFSRWHRSQFGVAASTRLDPRPSRLARSISPMAGNVI